MKKTHLQVVMLDLVLPDPCWKMEHYPIFQKVLPDLCRFDKFALPDLSCSQYI